MKRFRVLMSFVISIVLAGAASGQWIPLTDSVTLSSLAGESLVFGDKEISEFHLFGDSSGGAINPNPDNMFVQGGQDDVSGDYGLKFNFSWNAASNQTINATLNFKVSILPLPEYDDYYITDVGMYITGASATDTGVVNIGEIAWDDFPGGSVVASLSCSKQAGDGGDFLVDHAEFAPLKEIWIQSKDVSITGGTGAGGSAHLSEFFQFYSQIPEPATFVLLGIGGLLALTRKGRVV